MNDIYLKIYVENGDTLVFEGQGTEDKEGYYPTRWDDKGHRIGTVAVGKEHISITEEAKEAFRKIVRESRHPGDNKAKSVLMELYNHSSEKMTNKYIGETAKLEKEYLEDFGEKYKKYVMDGEEIPFLVRKPISVYDNKEVLNYIY